MKKKLIFSLLIIMIFVNTCTFNAYAELLSKIPKIEDAAAMLLEADRGQVLFKKNDGQYLHISSASKLMTALIALEKIKLDSKVTISKAAASAKGSVLNLTAGDKFSAEDLICAVMLTPANDAAVALAEYVSGDVNKFVEAMNTKAKELKMSNTRFANPTGLYDEKQYTTAEDLSAFMLYALKNPDFNRILSMKGKPINSMIVVNSNKLFWSYNGVDGGKAGYNDRDKQTAITTATRGNQRLIAIVLDSTEESIWKDSINLLDYGFNNYMTSILVSKDQVLRDIYLGDQEIGLIPARDIFYTHPVGNSFISKVSFDVPVDLKLPLHKSNPVATATYFLQDGTKIDIQLYPNREMEIPRNLLFQAVSKLKETKDLMFIVFLLLFIELMLIIRKIAGLIKKENH